MSSNINNIVNKLGIPLEEDLDFRALIYGLWENKFLILAVTLVIVTISMAYTITKVSQYESNILIQVDSKKSNGLGFSNVGLGVASTIDASSVQSELIKSRFILEPVIDQLGLAISVKPRYFPIIGRKHLKDVLIIKNLILPYNYYEQPLLLTVVSKNSYSLTDKKGNILAEGKVGKIVTNNQLGVEVLVTKLNADSKARFDVIRHSSTNITGSILAKLSINELGHSEGTKTGILQINLKDPNRDRLVNILNQIANVIVQKDIERKLTETTKTLEFLENNLPMIRNSLDKAESNLNRYRAANVKLDIKLESQAVMMQLQGVEKQITETTLKKISLLQNYTNKHPFITEINNKLSQLQNEKLMLQNKAKKLPASDQVMMSLMREVAVKTRLYVEMLNKIEEFKVNKAAMSSDIRILSFAPIPNAPLSKQTNIVFVASVILGLIIGSIIVLVRKSFLRHINDPGWIENHYNIPNCAIIPYSKSQANNVHSFKVKEKTYIEILAEKNPRDLVIEALRSLRTSFQILMAGSSNNIVSLTGCSPSIGKSFISVNFAYLLADVGKRVLLIDADIRKGYLQNYFNVHRSPGLTELLLGSHSLEQTIKKIKSSNLSFLSSGSFPSNPSELLMGQNFKDLLKLLSEQFDLVLIDTPPILAVTDSAIIGALSGTNLLVVGSNIHQAEEISLALKRFESSGVKIQGTIFNYLRPQTSSYGQYQYKYHDEEQSTVE